MLTKDRSVLYTKVAAYDDRLKIWKDAIEATQRHIQVAKAFQEAGIKLIKKMRENDRVSPDDMAKCLTNLEKGTKLERDANRELIELYNMQPREKA